MDFVEAPGWERGEGGAADRAARGRSSGLGWPTLLEDRYMPGWGALAVRKKNNILKKGFRLERPSPGAPWRGLLRFTWTTVVELLSSRGLAHQSGRGGEGLLAGAWGGPLESGLTTPLGWGVAPGPFREGVHLASLLYAV